MNVSPREEVNLRRDIEKEKSSEVIGALRSVSRSIQRESQASPDRAEFQY